jgi:AraC family transcriptional regulator
MNDAAPTAYHGDFVAWTGGCALIGEGRGSIAPHSHYAIQVALAASAPMRIQFGRDAAWQNCAGAVVPSRAMHSIDVDACDWSTVLFIEPETAAGKAIAARLQGGLELLPRERVDAACARLERAWRVERREEAVKSVYRQLVEEVSGTPAREPSDKRVLASVAYLRERVDQPVTLDALAREVHLSPSRFRHLFVQETGMPLRTYVLWRRLLHVWSLLMQGESLSQAAHAAGFADSAHLSRTSRAMFGVAPSMLKMTGPLSARAPAPPAR